MEKEEDDDDDVMIYYIMMKCVFVCHEKSLPTSELSAGGGK